MPARMARKVNSGTPFSEWMYGWNSSGGAGELQVFVAKRHLRNRQRRRQGHRHAAAHYRLKRAWGSRELAGGVPGNCKSKATGKKQIPRSHPSPRISAHWDPRSLGTTTFVDDGERRQAMAQRRYQTW